MDAALADEFSEFMVGRWSMLVRFGYGLTGDQGLAEDLAQTALIKVCAAWLRVRRVGDPDAYVRRVMINANRSRFRRRGVAEHLSGSLPDVSQPPDDQVPDSALLAALMSLPVGQRAVVVLRYWMDLSEAETAAVLGCSTGTVKSQAARALAKLRLNTELMTEVKHGTR